MKTKISFSSSIEFLNAFKRYSDLLFVERTSTINPEIRTPEEFKPSGKIASWKKNIDENTSPFMKNDIFFLYPIFDVLMYRVIDLIFEKNIQSSEELIRFLTSMDSVQFVTCLLKEEPKNSEYKNDIQDIINNLDRNFDENLVKNIREARKYPAEFQNKIMGIFSFFSRNFLLPQEKMVEERLSEKKKTHEKFIEEYGEEFINSVGMGDYGDVLKSNVNLTLYVSYYLDRTMYYYFSGNEFRLFYGYRMEDRFTDKNGQEKYIRILKAISDEKRYEIIKLTSERPWFNKELADYFNLTSASLSYHLNLLLDLDILRFKPAENNRYYYSANKEYLKEILNNLYSSLVSD